MMGYFSKYERITVNNRISMVDESTSPVTLKPMPLLPVKHRMRPMKLKMNPKPSRITPANGTQQRKVPTILMMNPAFAMRLCLRAMIRN